MASTKKKIDLETYVKDSTIASLASLAEKFIIKAQGLHIATAPAAKEFKWLGKFPETEYIAFYAEEGEVRSVWGIRNLKAVEKWLSVYYGEFLDSFWDDWTRTNSVLM
jgi:hypothetical protein